MKDPYCQHCGVVDDLHNKLYCNIIQDNQRRFLEAYNKACRYEEALLSIRDCDWVITLPDRMDAVRAIAREALDE